MITLKTLPQATAQEVFDQVATHLLTQKQKALGLNGECVYRGLSSLRCAASCLIADDEYQPEMEGHNWRGLIKANFVANPVHQDLIMRLQSVHDFVCPVDWKDRLGRTADAFGLSHEVLAKF